MKQKQLKFLLLVFLLSQVAYYSFSPLYALFATSFGLTPKIVSFIWSGYSLLTACLILLMGKLENKKKKGRVILLAYIVYAFGSLSFLLVHNEATLMAALALNALAAGIMFPAYKTMFASSEAKGKESEQWAWLDAGNMLAAACGAGIGGLIIGSFGFKGIFVGMAAIQFIAAFVAYRYFYLSS
jgi:MFS family permease